MSWKVVYTTQAKQDLRNIYEYIAYTLLAPDTAAGQARRVMKEIRSLDEMPMRFRCYEQEPWHSRGLRCFSVDRYLVFYLPEPATGTVFVVSIMYGGRDISQRLPDVEI